MFSTNPYSGRLRNSQSYTYMALSAAFYNNGLREVGRDTVLDIENMMTSEVLL